MRSEIDIRGNLLGYWQGSNAVSKSYGPGQRMGRRDEEKGEGEGETDPKSKGKSFPIRPSS